jgi:UTP--glucose-1-phosphate uridylyltransferase
LADGRPLIAWGVEEARKALAQEIIFVVSPNQKKIGDFFKRDLKTERILKNRKKSWLLAKLRQAEKTWQGLRFSFIEQPRPSGDGDAILRARARVGRKPFFVSFCDDVVWNKKSVFRQLKEVFQKYRAPVVALKKMTREDLVNYGVPAIEKAAAKIFRLTGLVEKPKFGRAPSGLAVVGKYLLTPEVFNYLEKAKPVFQGEVVLAKALEQMIKDGRMVYGLEIEGDWLEYGTIDKWRQSNLILAKKLKLLP